MQTFSLIWRMLRRDWRAGEVRVLALAVVVAVASISAVSFFSDRIGQALTLQANELLGGDLVLGSTEPLKEATVQLGQQYALRVVTTVEFPSMVLAGEQSQLAAVKAVEEGYPLRGALRTATQLFVEDSETAGVPAPGTVWAESRLLTALGLQVGSTLTLGAVPLSVAAVITHEPARAGGSLFSIAPRLLLNYTDLARTQLITPASRVRYNTLFAGEPQQITQFRQALGEQLSADVQVQGVDDARPEVRSALDKATRFLGLSSLVSVVMASIAIAMASRRYVARHLDNCAIMRCYGAQQQTILRLYGGQMLLLGLVASGVGVLLGYALQAVLVNLFGALTAVTLPPSSWWPAITGVGVGSITLLGFSFPTLMALRDVPPLRVLRRELGGLPANSGWLFGVGMAALAVIAVWQAGSLWLGGWVLLGMVATTALLAAMALLLIKALVRLAPLVTINYRFGLINITRRRLTSTVQMVAFGLGMMVLLLLTLVRTDLLTEWQGRLPDQAPNRFLINIQPEQVAAISTFLGERLTTPITLYPMVRGRLAAINGTEVSEVTVEGERAQRLVAREFNLSWAQQLAPNNSVVQGAWWSGETAEGELSVEEGLAQTLHLKLGDTLTFRIAGQEVTGRIANLRKVVWDNFQVNFFVVAAPGLLEPMPTSYITSFYLPAEQQQLLLTLLKQYPNITIIDVAAVLAQVRHIIERVTQAIEYLFLFTLLAGFIVLYATIEATLDERMREVAILRTLGASRQMIWRTLLTEFVLLGLMAGAVAAFAATGVGYLLAGQIFELPYHLNPWLWGIGLLVGGLSIGVAGMWGMRTVLTSPPLQVLREL